MHLKTMIVAVILAAAPTFSLANCGAHHTNISASSCAPGQVWDANTNTCVEQPTG